VLVASTFIFFVHLAMNFLFGLHIFVFPVDHYQYRTVLQLHVAGFVLKLVLGWLAHAGHWIETVELDTHNLGILEMTYCQVSGLPSRTVAYYEFHLST
jgi:hypothetical protein